MGTPKKGEKIVSPKGAVKPKEDTQVRYLKTIGARKRGDVSTVHRALAEKLVSHKKVELFTEGMPDLDDDIFDEGGKSDKGAKSTTPKA